MTEKIVNDFNITFSTINGSGSSTANSIILKALFKMGIPVSGKNVFPSNIQGLPTWYSIRVNKDGFLGRVERDDIIVEMNPETVITDEDHLNDNGVLIYNDQFTLPEFSKRIISYALPVEKILNECHSPTPLRIYLANMVYVGVLVNILKIDLSKINEALDEHFNGHNSAIEPNLQVIQASFDWSKSHLKKIDHFFIKPIIKTQENILTDGNTAAALGSIYGGLQFISWYPITPATSLPESLNEYLPILRKEKFSGKNTFVSIQAEDELAAIGMVVGAAWAGLRAMTATSGPGLCLMSEYLGLAYLSEVPVVVWDVQRVGPSTGLPTHTSQGDLTFSYFLSHGDKEYPILLPGSVYECFEFAWRALDIADELQTPVIVLSDLDLGMNQWITPKFKYPDTPINRGKILWEKELQEMLERRNGDWGRYLDIDGDGIPYRTVPGNNHLQAPYFARGTGHDEYGRYSENPDVWERVHLRLQKKMGKALQIIPNPIEDENEKATIGVISFGSSDLPVTEACHILRQNSIQNNYLRIRAIPFNKKIQDFLEEHEKTYVVEANRDGQMAQLLKMNFPNHNNKILSIAHSDGLSLSAKWISDKILLNEG